MCGINGLVRLAGGPELDREELVRTRDAMAVRGPDGAGSWVAADGTAALGHRRLAILGLGEAGDQPMASPDGRYRLVFNGEIYNFRELRAELERDGERFVTATDTEVLLRLLAREGTAALPRLRGMFALALWDEPEHRLLLARDPLGIKPLYWAEAGGTFRFASQVRALEAGGVLSPALDPGALAGFLVWGSVPEPLTIRRAVRALPAGSWLEVSDGRVGEPVPWYGFPPTSGTERSGGTERIVEALGDSVRAHLVADVPVAVFLSAGIDSNLVAGLAASAGPPPTALTLRFASTLDGAHDEGPLARRAAAHLGMPHREQVVSPAELAEAWPRALAAMDQPSIDGLNTWLIARMAAEAGFKAVLSGVGGDELLGGYPSFRDVPRLARWAARLAAVPAADRAWPRAARTFAPGRPKLEALLGYGRTLAGAYLLRRAVFLPEDLPGILGDDLAAEGLSRHDPVEHAAATLAQLPPELRSDPWVAVHHLETSLYLRNQLLRDADWAAMASSVELRTPLVDATLRAAVLAEAATVRRLGKRGVAAATAALPAEILEKPKSGFYVPVAAALDGEGGASLGSESRRLARRVLAAWDFEVAA